MGLQELWFGLIGVLFLGFFILEGFDFGVGMLMEPFAHVGTGDPEAHRRTALNTIGPVWDGNEVWLLTAGAGMFAAFPGWYATVFSTLYLPLLAILFGMIVRSVSIEWRGKINDTKWRALADFGIAAGSWLPAVLWGVAFAILVRGLPVDASGHIHLSIGDVLNPYTLLGGLATAGLFLLYGAVFVGVEDLRLHPRRRTSHRGVGVATGHGIGCGLWALDSTCVRQELDVAGAGSRGSRAARRGGIGMATRIRWLGVPVYRAGGRGRGDSVVRLAVPEPGALDAERAMERHDLQRLVDALHPQDHDMGDRVPRAAHGGLPSMDVLGFPATHLD